jgi:hypothetical protein
MATNNPFMPTPGAAPVPTPTNGGSVSDNFEVDLSNVQTNGFTIPDGSYKVKCVEVEQSVSSSGNPMFVWTFEVTEGDHIGFQSKVFTAITPAAMWKVAETVIALGVGQTGEVVKFKRTDVVGKECGAIFEQSEYNGTMRSQISKVISLKELAESRS